MKKTLLLLSFASLLMSCLTASIKPLGYQKRLYDTPDKEKTEVREIGDNVAEKGQEEYSDAYTITKKDTRFKVSLVDFDYPVGTILPLSGETNNYFLYYKKSEGKPYTIGVAKNKKTGVVLPFGNSVNGFYVKNDVVGFEAIESKYSNSDCVNCFKKEMVYNGKSGTGLKFVYREYVNDLARPAFFQELQYDLADSNIIGFKGLRIEVIKATNTSIEYKVIKSFD